MQKVLVTGANGFIGSKMMEFLTKKEFAVVGIDRKQSDALCDDIIMTDLENLEDILQKLETINPDIIIHCAGSADVWKSVQNPQMDFMGNVSITHNLLFALHKLQLKQTRVVYLSSAAVYGNPIRLPISEDTSCNPLSPYALHKVMCENMCTYFIRNYDMDIKIARIFSAYGPGLKKQIFWDMYRKIYETKTLHMFGTGAESRDYIYIDDLVQAIYLLATTQNQEYIYNVGNGQEITISKAVSRFAECAGMETDRIFFNGVIREGDPLNWRADITRLQKIGYQQSVSIDEGIQAYYQWVMECNGKNEFKRDI